MKSFYIILVLFFLNVACRNSNQNKEMDLYFEREIKGRMKILNAYLKSNDSGKINVSEIDKEVNNIILLSKDVENLGASVNRANKYFKALSEKYEINSFDFTTLSVAMHPNDIATILKQNELNVFNQLIFKNNIPGISPYTAQ